MARFALFIILSTLLGLREARSSGAHKPEDLVARSGILFATSQRQVATVANPILRHLFEEEVRTHFFNNEETYEQVVRFAEVLARKAEDGLIDYRELHFAQWVFRAYVERADPFEEETVFDITLDSASRSVSFKANQRDRLLKHLETLYIALVVNAPTPEKYRLLLLGSPWNFYRSPSLIRKLLFREEASLLIYEESFLRSPILLLSDLLADLNKLRRPKPSVTLVLKDFAEILYAAKTNLKIDPTAADYLAAWKVFDGLYREMGDSALYASFLPWAPSCCHLSEEARRRDARALLAPNLRWLNLFRERASSAGWKRWILKCAQLLVGQ